MRFGIDERMLLRQVNVFITRLAEQNARQSARDAAMETVTGRSAEQQADIADDKAVPQAVGDSSLSASGPSDVVSPVTEPRQEMKIETRLRDAIDRGADPLAKALEPQERALMRLVLKYGMLDLGDEFGTYDDGGHVKVIDYIREDVLVYNIQFRNPLYRGMFP